MSLTILLRSVEATTPSVSETERIVVMSTIQGAEVSNQKVLERFKCRPHTSMLAGLAQPT